MASRDVERTVILRPAIAALLCVVLASCRSGGDGGTGGRAAPSLAEFTGGTWRLVVDRTWDGLAGKVQLPSDALPESAYAAVAEVPAYRIVVSAGGDAVEIGEDPLLGRRTKQTDALIEYKLGKGTFAGGRFVVRAGGDGLQGELTIYGSGRPIVSSERGPVLPAR